MRDFKRLMTEQGEDLFHKNMKRFGATVRESHKAYKDIKYGNIGGSDGGSSRPKYTGHADAEGLKAIGWTDEDIAYYQENGVNWNEEDDEYHKVSEDNKALYGVMTADNISTYKDRIVYLPKIDTSNVTDMAWMFEGCTSLVSIPLLDTSSAKYMNSMFTNCYALVSIPQLDTSNVTDMSYMFQGCFALVSIPQLDTSNVTNMNSMFYGCSLLVSVPQLDTQNVTNMNSMFANCSVLVSIPEFNTSKVTKTNNMFNYCYSLVYTHLKNINIGCKFNFSSLLSKDSILYIINNESATSAITITLHSYAYTRLANDADVVAALNNHPNISLSK